MKNLFVMLIVLLALTASTAVYARGQSADDCPPGSTDPDCKQSATTPPGK